MLAESLIRLLISVIKKLKAHFNQCSSFGLNLRHHAYHQVTLIPKKNLKKNADDPACQVCSRKSVFLYYDFWRGFEDINARCEHLG